MAAQRALFHRLGRLVPIAHAVRAGHHAVLAADALLAVDEHHVVAVAVAGAGGAHVHARGVGALLAHGGQRVARHVRVVAEGPALQHLVPMLAQGDVVLHLARDLAGVAARAAIEVHHNAVMRHNRTPPRWDRSAAASKARTARARSTRLPEQRRQA